MTRAIIAVVLFTLPAFAAPVPKAVKKPAVPSVSGTSWLHQGHEHGPVTYTFEENGRLSYRFEGQEANHECGSWKLDGDTLKWDTHNHYADFTVTFSDGVFTGTAKSVEGKSWAVTLKPVVK